MSCRSIWSGSNNCSHGLKVAARKLLVEGKARVLTQSEVGAATEADVEVQEATHCTWCSCATSGDKCTCPWFSKHLGQRRPVQARVGGENSRRGRNARGRNMTEDELVKLIQAGDCDAVAAVLKNMTESERGKLAAAAVKSVRTRSLRIASNPAKWRFLACALDDVRRLFSWGYAPAITRSKLDHVLDDRRPS